MEEEIWKQSYVPLWEVNTLGQVRNKRLNRVIKPFWKNGYLHVGQSGRKAIGRHPVHKLVCIAFHGERPEGKCIDHIDGNKENNRADNLRWLDWRENSKKQNKSGTSEASGSVSDREPQGSRKDIVRQTLGTHPVPNCIFYNQGAIKFQGFELITSTGHSQGILREFCNLKRVQVFKTDS